MKIIYLQGKPYREVNFSTNDAVLLSVLLHQRRTTAGRYLLIGKLKTRKNKNVS